MPISQPEVSKTQDWKERNAALSVAATATHADYELYFAATEIEGSGTLDHAQSPPVYKLTAANQHMDITHYVPSYWWNGQVKVSLVFMDITGQSSPFDVDMFLKTYSVGSSTARTTVIDDTSEGADFVSSITPDSTANKLYEVEVWSSENITEDDDLLHLNIEMQVGSPVNFGIAAITIEYYPAFEQ